MVPNTTEATDQTGKHTAKKNAKHWLKFHTFTQGKHEAISLQMGYNIATQIMAYMWRNAEGILF